MCRTQFKQLSATLARRLNQLGSTVLIRLESKACFKRRAFHVPNSIALSSAKLFKKTRLIQTANLIRRT